jgi:AraC family transcriptional regulator of adaptative response / DNA-3-methyladenine glycosylase II
MDLDRPACYRALAARDRRFDGKFFACVATTRIFCRPICPARTPKPENCRFVRSAAEAFALGYRPCLRCRPEASPAFALWRGTSNSVERALRLIAEGALDGEDMEALALRVGLGGRHLRRLFRQHLGVSPGQVAQTRRLLFAKSLITETTMPLAHVALASGYGSVRRFNAAIRRTYRREPRQLRRAAGGEQDQGATLLSLAYSPPYDWQSLSSFLSARAIPGVEQASPEGYRRTIALDGAKGTVSVSPAADGRPCLEATIRFPKLTALPAIVARLNRVFDLGADPSLIAGHLGGDPVLAPHVGARPGLRVPGAWDGFELAVRAILGQQVSVAAATTLAGRLAERFGERLGAAEAEGGLTLVFPTPERLADADIAASLGMPAQRARAIQGLAREAARDPRLFHPMQTLEEAVKRLCELPGIGRWTAEYIAMRALGEPDAFPTGDIGLMRAMADGDGRRPTPAQLDAAAEAWRPWRAYATLHLWTADAPPSPSQETRHGAHPRSRAVADRRDPARL